MHISIKIIDLFSSIRSCSLFFFKRLLDADAQIEGLKSWRWMDRSMEILELTLQAVPRWISARAIVIQP